LKISGFIAIDNIDVFPIHLKFLFTYNIQDFMQTDDIDHLGTIEMLSHAFMVDMPKVSFC
jgi:hypothetical protein